MKKLLLLTALSLCSAIAFGQSQATYSVTFDSNWSQAAHPHSSGNLPGTAHWSRLVGATHNQDITFWEFAGIATSGVEDIAETGSNTAFFAEVNASISAGDTNNLINGDALSTALGQINIDNIITTDEYPLLTLLSMIAPSPDWMIGVSSVSLLDTNDEWKDEIIIDLYPIDAGTDSGVDYTSGNSNTVPAEPISNAQGIPPFSSEIIGTLTITLDSVLGVTSNTANVTSLVPNPAQNVVTITNTRNLLNSISVYNVLGKQVISANSINSTSHQLDIDALPSGVYLVRVLDDQNNETTQRLIKR